MKNRKNKEEEKMARPRAFAIAKGCFAAAKQNGQNGNPWVRYSEAVLRPSESLHCDEGTVHMGQNFYFVSESPVFVHRFFRNPNK